MKKLIAFVLGLFIALPVFAGECNLYTTENSTSAWINETGGAISTSNYICTDFIQINPNTAYSVYAKLISSPGSSHGVRIGLYDANKTFISPRYGGTAAEVGDYIYNFTTPSNARYIRVSSGNTGVVSQVIITPGTYTTSNIPTNMSSCPATCPNGGTAQTYTSATGTVTVSGTPTPENPVYPTFYTQGNMTLYKVDKTYYDSYDATTGKITRKVGKMVFDGTEDWYSPNATQRSIAKAKIGYKVSGTSSLLCSHYPSGSGSVANTFYVGGAYVNFIVGEQYTMEEWKAYLAEQYAAGTPVTIWYPLEEPVEEDWAAEQCVAPIKIATTKYNNAAFSSVVTALSNAVDTIKTVVANTITQATAVANLHSGKQTKPTDTCPAGKTCLLVEDMNGDPHWYEIVESYYNPTLPAGYTELAYLESTGTQYIDTDYVFTTNSGVLDIDFVKITPNSAEKQGWGSYAGDSRCLGIWFNTTVHNVQIGGNNLQLPSLITTDERHHMIVTANNGQATVVLDDNQVINSSYTGTIVNSKPWFLFSMNNNGTSYKPVAMKVYSTKLYDDGVLVRDFVPARRNSDGVLGMYDTVSGNFFTNAGTGEFTAGPVVLPDGYTALEYLEGGRTSGAYIDLGYPGTLTMQTLLRASVNAVSSSDSLMFGAADASAFVDGNPYAADVFASKVMLPIGKYVSGTGTLFSVTKTITSGTVYDFKMNYPTQGQFCVDSDCITASPTAPVTSKNLYLFGFNGNGVYSTQYSANAMRVYSLVQWDNGTLIHNWVPAKQGNTAGMYDLATGDFKTSAGSGSFTAGPVVQ